MWRNDSLEELIQEAELCERKFSSNATNISEEQAVQVFSRLVLQGKIREAVRYITDRAENGGIFKPDDDAGKGKSVKEVLMEKHPDQSIPDPEAFISCDELPTLIDVDVSSDHIKKSCSFLIWKCRW